MFWEKRKVYVLLDDWGCQMDIALTRILTVLALVLVPAAASGQDLANSRAMPGNEAPAGPHIFYWGPLSQTAPHGRPENQWRYRLWNERWWYWSTNEDWWLFNGDTWVPYTADSKFNLSRGPFLGPISGPFGVQGVITRGKRAGLTLLAGDHAAAPHLKRGTVLPKYLRPEPTPDDVEP
jgi:hypothetical protein